MFKYDGDVTVTVAGSVVQDLDIEGVVIVQAPNVTIKNCIIRGRGTLDLSNYTAQEGYYE